jgi:hypothetical protein
VSRLVDRDAILSRSPGIARVATTTDTSSNNELRRERRRTAIDEFPAETFIK